MIWVEWIAWNMHEPLDLPMGHVPEEKSFPMFFTTPSEIPMIIKMGRTLLGHRLEHGTQTKRFQVYIHGNAFGEERTIVLVD